MSKETFDRNKPYRLPTSPPSMNGTDITAVVAAGVNSAFSFSFTGGDDADYYFALYATAPYSAGRMSSAGQNKVLLLSAQNSGLLGVLDFTQEYTNRFGNLTVGSMFTVEIDAINVNSGQRYSVFQSSPVVTE